MTKQHKLTLQARADLEDIWRYIAEDNPAAADRVEAALYESFDKLAQYPGLGHWREDIASKRVRFWGVHSYQIIYDPETDPLVILRILSGWRDIGGILDDGWLE